MIISYNRSGICCFGIWNGQWPKNMKVALELGSEQEAKRISKKTKWDQMALKRLLIEILAILLLGAQKEVKKMAETTYIVLENTEISTNTLLEGLWRWRLCQWGFRWKQNEERNWKREGSGCLLFSGRNLSELWPEAMWKAKLGNDELGCVAMETSKQSWRCSLVAYSAKGMS